MSASRALPSDIDDLITKNPDDAHTHLGPIGVCIKKCSLNDKGHEFDDEAAVALRTACRQELKAVATK